MWRIVTILLLVTCATVRAQQHPASAPTGVDPALWQRMLEVDVRGSQIKDMLADFEQSKFTTLLKKPLVSKGTVRVGPTAMLWDTTSPQPMIMRITENEASVYYPKEKLVEVYPITGQLGSLAASPLPRLNVLKQYFQFAPASAKDLDPSANDKDCLAVLLTPVDQSVREHVKQVRVLLDTNRGFMIRFEMTDPDGDRTVMSFSNVRVNTGLKDSADLTIRTPPDVKVVHPLENLGPAPAPRGTRP